MRRKTFDALAVIGGLILAVVLLVAGGLLLWGHGFVNDQVHTQLAAQKIYFPPASSGAIKALPATDAQAMTAHAGQQMTLPMHELHHGTTLHGLQVTRPSERRLPTSYYHPSGPIGRLFAGLRADREHRPLDEVAVVGLGVGTLAAYAQPGEHFTFFEIDPAIVRIASDPALFSYLRDCAGTASVAVGDGRLALATAPDAHFRLIVIDAFGSDAVPVHLLTREALALDETDTS